MLGKHSTPFSRTLPFLLALAACACGAGVQDERAALRKEESASELLKKGQASAAVGDLTRAEQYLVSAERAGGDEKKIIVRLLLVCVADDRYPVALEYAERFLHRHPEDLDVKFAAASLYAATGNGARARELFAGVVKVRPEWPEPHYAFATVLRQMAPSTDADADAGTLALADVQDLEYLKRSPGGPFAEAARSRLRRVNSQ